MLNSHKIEITAVTDYAFGLNQVIKNKRILNY
jgi:hypothetical protein